MAAAAQFPGWTHDAGLVRVYCQDSDLLCTKMAKLNVLLYGLNGSRNRYIYEVARLTGADMESSQRCVRRAADPLPGASADVQMTLF